MLQWFQKSSDVSEEPERRNKNTSKITVNPTVSQYDLQPMFRYATKYDISIMFISQITKSQN
uniref:Bm409 n=1 Tax=Brugia malayi TaxID=6279 RepID=A0A1I9G1N2_BRUMA|nr:Bm409 [Brugia malayi]